MRRSGWPRSETSVTRRTVPPITEPVLSLKVGDRVEFEKTVTAEDVARFADVTGDTVRAAAVVKGEAVVLLDPVS